MKQTNITHENHLGVESIPRLLMKYAIPSIVSMVVMSIYNIVDQIFIGRGVGFLGNGATTVAFPIITITLAVALLIGNGAAAFISLELGRGNKDNADNALGITTSLMLISGVALAVLLLIFLEPILRLMGATPGIMPYAIDYTGVLAFGFPFVMASIGLSSIIRSDGSPMFSMVIQLVGTVINVIFDPIFIFVFGMGVKGAAIATVISQFVSFVLGLYYVMHKGHYVKLTLSCMKLRWSIIKTISLLGSASFISQISLAVVNVIQNNSLTYYGALSEFGSDIPLSAMGIVMKINGILIAVLVGITIGAQPILGYNYGAGNYKRVKETYRVEVIICLILGALATILFQAFPELVVGLFNDPNPEFNKFAARVVRIALLLIITASFQIPSSTYFQAVGKPGLATLLTMSRQLILLIPAILILPLFLGLEGVLWAMPAADLLSTIITTFFIARELRYLSSRGNSAAPATALPDCGEAE